MPDFVRWMDLSVGIHDLVDEREAAGGVSNCLTGILAGVQDDECVLGESSQFRHFHFLPESPCSLF